jgi:hypothetical protein
VSESFFHGVLLDLLNPGADVPEPGRQIAARARLSIPYLAADAHSSEGISEMPPIAISP